MPVALLYNESMSETKKNWDEMTMREKWEAKKAGTHKPTATPARTFAAEDHEQAAQKKAAVKQARREFVASAAGRKYRR